MNVPTYPFSFPAGPGPDPAPFGFRVTGIQAGYPQRLGTRPHEFISRVKRRCEEIAAKGGDPRSAIRAELATARAVFKQEYGEELDMAIGLDGGEWVR
jgi:hypothetical protein